MDSTATYINTFKDYANTPLFAEVVYRAENIAVEGFEEVCSSDASFFKKLTLASAKQLMVSSLCLASVPLALFEHK